MNKNRPLSKADNVGARKVNTPMDVAGFIYGTSQPKMSPHIVPYKGPSNGAVKLESKTLENVIETNVPGMG